MVGDGTTLPEHVRDALLRAHATDDDDARTVVAHHLVDERPRARVLSLRAGARHGWITEPQWRDALEDPSGDVRREAATLLATSPASDVLLDSLIARLGDDDVLVVDAAAHALGEKRWRAAVESLVTVARTHADARCRESAIAALGVIGDDRGRRTIIDALADKPAIRRRAVVALTNFTGDDVDDALALARQDRDWQVRAAIDQLDRGPLSDE